MPPVAVISRTPPEFSGVAALAVGANGARFCAIAFAATVVMPAAERPAISLRREMP
jgi:hypothetical protein